MLKTFRESLCAGILITIGGTVFLSCENKTVGAVLFSVALLCICYKSYYLFTGKIGYIVEQHTKQDFLNLDVGLFGNLAATFILGMLLRTVLPNIGEKAAEMCSAKLAQFPLYTFIRGFFCGILMYLAVSIYKEKNSVLGILFCVLGEILSRVSDCRYVLFRCFGNFQRKNNPLYSPCCCGKHVWRNCFTFTKRSTYR